METSVFTDVNQKKKPFQTWTPVCHYWRKFSLRVTARSLTLLLLFLKQKLQQGVPAKKIKHTHAPSTTMPINKTWDLQRRLFDVYLTWILHQPWTEQLKENTAQREQSLWDGGKGNLGTFGLELCYICFASRMAPSGRRTRDRAMAG